MIILCNVTDSTAEKEPPFHESVRDGQRKRIYESLHPEHHFHVEYRLLPEVVGERVYHTDVVTFGVASKVCCVQMCILTAEGGREGGERGEEGSGNQSIPIHHHSFLHVGLHRARCEGGEVLGGGGDGGRETDALWVETQVRMS